MFNISNRLRTAVVLASLCALSSAASAGLVSFRPQDGYVLQPGSIVSDVTYYNAGAFGSTYGSTATLANVPADSGQWSLKSSVGAFFATTADRSAMVSLAGNYGGTLPTFTAVAYMVGNHPAGRGSDGSSLAMRNDTPVGTGTMKYEYQLDSYDFGGVVPNAATSGKVKTQFYFCPNPGSFGGPNLGNKFGLTFVDQFGNVGLEWGYAYDNTVQWRTAGSAWTSTAFTADASNWDGVRVEIDLDSDTFSIDYYDASANVWSAMVPAGTALASSMANVSRLGWSLVDGTASGFGGKNFFDDFSFEHIDTRTPEPGSLVLALLALAAAGRARRSAQRP